MSVGAAQSLPVVEARWTAPANEHSEPRAEPAPRPAWRASTIASWETAVDRVITEMHKRLDEPLSLGDLADIAYLSPFHFNRVFRQITGVSPCRFLTSLRMDAAKHYLRTSDMRVTDICFAVGYSSLGTFTSQFTDLVGLSPGRYRRLHRSGGNPLSEEAEKLQPPRQTSLSRGEVRGWVSISDPSPFWIFVGLFRTQVPSGDPVACTLLTDPGPFCLSSVPEGWHHLLAAAMPRNGQRLVNEFNEKYVAYVSAGDSRIQTIPGRIPKGATDLKMRPPRRTDPPIVIDLPQVILDQQEHELSAQN